MIPDAIKDLPKFDGNPGMLHEFINNVEEILQVIKETDGTPNGQILLRAIRNKIEGKAKEVLIMHNTPLNWVRIKDILIQHYADKRTQTSLIKDLHDLQQDNKTVEVFYNEIIAIQSSLNNNLLLNEQDARVITSKEELFSEMCLNSFLQGLREPLGSKIRAMRPESLATALSCCIREQTIYYQNKNKQFKPKYMNYGPQYRQYNQQPFYNRPYDRFRNNTATYYQNNRSYVPYANSQNTYNNRFNNARSNYHDTNPSNNYNLETNLRPNNFNENRAIMFPKPEPIGTNNSAMSRFTNFTTRSNRNPFTQPKEINNVDNSNRDYQDININEEICNIEDTQNFHLLASKNLRVI